MDKQTLSLACLLASVAGLIVSAVSGSFMPDKPLIWQVSLGVGLVLLVAYGVLQFKTVAALFSKKRFRYGLNSVVMAVLGVAVVVFINLIANQYDVKKDLTKNKLHSLSEQSIKVIKNLDTDITIRPIINSQRKKEWNRAFDRYTYHTDKVKVEYVDADKDPEFVQQHKITRYGTVIFESAARSTKVDSLRDGPADPKFEEKLTNAIIHVAKGNKRKIYFVTGHGERSTEDRQANGYSNAKEDLESGRYVVANLLLMDQKEIPKDTDMLIIAGPRSDFMAHELDMVKKYLNEGGRVLVMVDPGSTSSIGPLLKQFGAEWKPRMVMVENSPLARIMGSPLAPIVTDYSRVHDITKETKEVSVFPVATPVRKAKKVPANYTVTELFSTRASSVEVFLPKNGKINLSEVMKKKRAAQNLALAVLGKLEEETKKEKQSPDKKETAGDKKAETKKQVDKELRLVIVGDSDFASNRNRRTGVNSDLFQNMLAWLSNEEDLISIRPKATDSSKFDITEARMLAIFWVSVLLAPLAVILSGLFVWLTRRKK